jgi:cobalt-zinc-cadmium efflux system outer membrane protein
MTEELASVPSSPRSSICAVVLLGASLVASRASALPAPPRLPAQLTLDEALHIFRTSGLDLLLAEAAVRGAEADVRAAGAVPNPSVGLSYAHTFTYNPNDPVGCAQSNATCSPEGFAVDLGDQGALSELIFYKRGLRLRVARLALAAARESRSDAQRNLEFQVKQQYIQAVLGHDLLDFAVDVEKKATQILELNQVRYRAGAISEADVAKVEAAKLEADQAVASARQNLEVARLELALLLGIRGAMPQFDVATDLPSYAVPVKLANATRESLLVTALQSRPDLRAIAHQRERAAESIRLAHRGLVPDIALDLNYQQTGSGGIGTNAPLTPPTLTVGLSAALPLFYQQQGEIRRAEADLMTQEVQRAKVEAQVLNDISTAFTNFVASRELVERMQARLLDRAARARDLVNIQYQKGAASLLELLDAERTYIAVNQEYLQDLANYWTAIFQLEQAVGTELRR